MLQRCESPSRQPRVDQVLGNLFGYSLSIHAFFCARKRNAQRRGRNHGGKQTRIIRRIQRSCSRLDLHQRTRERRRQRRKLGSPT